MLKVLEGGKSRNQKSQDDEDGVGLETALDELARQGARRMIAAALKVEANDYVARFAEERDGDGRALVVRNGSARPRPVTTGTGTFELKAPRVNDKRVVDGNRQRFTSRILPPYMRRSPKVDAVLPLLYLHGLSTGDFREALPVLLGDDAAGRKNGHLGRVEGVGSGRNGFYRPFDAIRFRALSSLLSLLGFGRYLRDRGQLRNRRDDRHRRYHPTSNRRRLRVQRTRRPRFERSAWALAARSGAGGHHHRTPAAEALGMVEAH